MKVRRNVVVLAGVLAALGAVTACGSDGGSTGASVEGDTLKIRVSAPLSGPTATAGTATTCGVRAYLEARNDEGGVGGYTFDVAAEDNQYDPGIAAALARDFATDGAFAVVVAGTSAMEATSGVLEARGIPIFGSPDGTVVSPPQWDGVFGYNAKYSSEGASAATFVRDELKEAKAASVYLSPAAQPAADGFASAFAKAGGKVVASEAVSPETTDYSALAQKLKSSGAPVIYATLVDTSLSGLQKAADAIGYRPKWVSWTIAQGPTYLELAGDLAEGVYFSQWAIPETQTDDPEVKKYVDAVGRIKGCAELAGDTAVKTGYALAAAIAYGVEHADSGDKLTTDAFIDALSDVQDQQFGLTPHMAYDHDSRAGVRQNSYWQVKSGKLVLVRDFEPLPSSPER